MAKIKWNLPAFKQVRNLPGVGRELQGEVDRVLTALGDEHGNYAGGVEQGRSRLRGYVVTADFAAMYDNASNHSLVAALGSTSGPEVTP